MFSGNTCILRLALLHDKLFDVWQIYILGDDINKSTLDKKLLSD